MHMANWVSAIRSCPKLLGRIKVVRLPVKEKGVGASPTLAASRSNGQCRDESHKLVLVGATPTPATIKRRQLQGGVNERYFSANETGSH